MCQAGSINQVGITAQRGAELAADLGALQRVGQPGPREVARSDLDYLRLGREPAQRGAVQDPGAIALELTAPGAACGLGRLGCPPGRRLAVVAGRHRLSLPPASSIAAAR